MDRGERIAAAARACVGVPFRPQGRDPAFGLDCVGLVAVAYRGMLRGGVPATYAQRGGDATAIGAALEAAGLRRAGAGGLRAGDLLLFATGPAQWHFAVSTGSGFVHADARLRRVVEVPGSPPWPAAGAWRSEGEG